MRIKLLLLFCFLNFVGYSQPRPLSAQAEASVLTMGPGKALYDSFGHSALRINDPALGIDVTYNYGVYDFSDPNFYLKFAKGQMRYVLDRRPTEGFLRNYVEDNRWIKEQVLNLKPEELRRLFAFLEDNLKPENRAYNYDFFYDNCATKIPDILQKIVPNLVFDSGFVEQPKTFRTLIQQNVYWNSWGSFGMDLGIGSVVDRQATAYQHMFLPEYVFKGVQEAIRSQNAETSSIVKETITLFDAQPPALSSNFWTSPLLVMLILAFIILFITYRDSKRERCTRYLDAVLHILLGMIGVVFLLLWFATDHYTTAYNYNLLWAFPLNLILGFQLGKKSPKHWVKAYLKFLVLMLCLLCLHWIIGVQVFPKALIPLLTALAVRYFYLLKTIDADLLPAVKDNGA